MPMPALRQFILFFFLLASCFTAMAQNEFSKWHFGAKAALDFATQPPTLLLNSQLQTFEGVASMCDSNGNLLFYTDGSTVYTGANTTMANGGGLMGHYSSTQSAIIVKQPGNNTLYYIFTTEHEGSPNGFRYSIVDMALAGGTGSVTVKNVQLYALTCEKQVAVRHCNGKDIWIVSHDCAMIAANNFYAYLLTAAGINTVAVISSVGEIVYSGWMLETAAAGQLKVSPDGKKLAMATATLSIPGYGNGGFQLFDFDNATGVVSNSLVLLGGQDLLPATGAYGVEFSPDGSKLYGSTASTNTTSTVLYQWDICAPTASAIIASQYSLSLNNAGSGSLQRAIDGKIYLSQTGLSSLSVINNPNGSGATMNYVANGLNLSPKSAFYGLPNFINQYSYTPPSPFTHTNSCRTSSFSAPLPASPGTGCQQGSNAPLAYLWNFGDPASGFSNLSTVANPVHMYSSSGTYTTTLVLYSACINDTLRQTVTVNPAVAANVAGNFQICKGEANTYTVSGGSSYVWSNNSADSAVTLSPTVTTVYSVTATHNGCSATTIFTITVNICLGSATIGNSTALRLFPNPVKSTLGAEAAEPAELLFMDMNGAVILETKVAAGHHEINVANLPAGVYTLRSKNEKATWRIRLVKVD